MKSTEYVKQNNDRGEKELVLKNPAWALYFGIIGGAVFLIGFLVFLYLKRLDRIEDDIFFFAYIFLGLFLLFAVLTYICIYEKLVFCDGVYYYYRPFGKNQRASVEEIKSVKILTKYVMGRCGMHKRIRIFFYGENNKVLIKIIDDGTVSENSEEFIRSLKSNRIKIKREEKHIDVQ
jgi:hypothetical protein